MKWRIKIAKPKVEAIVEVKEKIMPPPIQAQTRLTREQKGKWVVPKAPTVPARKKRKSFAQAYWNWWMLWTLANHPS